MSKYIQFSIVFSLIIVLAACGLKPPFEDKTPPTISIVASDSRFNPNSPYSYMRYETTGLRTETGFLTPDNSVNFRVIARDVGGVNTVTIRAQNGTITSGPYSGYFRASTELTTEGDTDVLVITSQEPRAVTPIDQTIAISPKTDNNNEVIVSVEATDLGGQVQRINTTTAPDVRIVFNQ